MIFHMRLCLGLFVLLCCSISLITCRQPHQVGTISELKIHISGLNLRIFSKSDILELKGQNGILLWNRDDTYIGTLDPSLAGMEDHQWVVVSLRDFQSLSTVFPQFSNQDYVHLATFFESGMRFEFLAFPPTLGLNQFAQDFALMSKTLHDDRSHDVLGCGRLEAISPLPLNYLTQNLAQTTQAHYLESVYLNPVHDLMTLFDESHVEQTASQLSEFPTRAYSTGKVVSDQVKELFSEAVGSDRDRWEITSSPIHVGEQENVIVRLKGVGSSTENKNSTVILGSHLDSINSASDGSAPGYDDNASGVGTLVEMVRLIAENKLSFQRNIEFHAYAAEEIGLFGSKYLAEQYAEEIESGERGPVAAMMQLDMTSYGKNEDTDIYLISTDTDENLRVSLKKIMDTYMNGGYQEKALHGGTSDHKSWKLRGFSVVFPFENPSTYNPYIHTDQDVKEHSNLGPLMKRFGQLALGFLGHYAGLSSAYDDYITHLDGLNSDAASNSDIFFAVTPHLDESQSSSPEAWSLLVSLPEEGESSGAERVEACFSADENETQCTLGHFTLQEADQDQNPLASQKRRLFFLPKQYSLTFSQDQVFLKVIGFGQQDDVSVLKKGVLVRKSLL